MSGPEKSMMNAARTLVLAIGVACLIGCGGKPESPGVEVDGQRGEEGARPYKEIHLDFTLKGNDLNEKKIERAINLSTEK